MSNKNEWVDQVEEFHKVYDCPIGVLGESVGTNLKILRQNLLMEEVIELSDAMKENNVVEVADAIVDCVYILLGTAHTYGLGPVIADVFAEVHASNMSKLGIDGRPVRREDGKVLKGPGYFKPKIADIIGMHQAKSAQG